jgi:hypothetical protein
MNHPRARTSGGTIVASADAHLIQVKTKQAFQRHNANDAATRSQQHGVKISFSGHERRSARFGRHCVAISMSR